MDKIPDAVIEAMCEAGGGSPYWQDYIVHNALKAAEAAGYALVPMEPDDAAVDTFADTYFTIGISGDWRRRSPNENHLKQMRELIRDGLRAMIAARPKVP